MKMEAEHWHFLNQFKTNEGTLKSIRMGTWGVCAACYKLCLITNHHVAPRSVIKQREWKPFNVMLCKRCHAIVHKLASNENLYMKHKTLADVIADIRKRINQLTQSNLAVPETSDITSTQAVPDPEQKPDQLQPS